jgi:hypothetical protein
VPEPGRSPGRSPTTSLWLQARTQSIELRGIEQAGVRHRRSAARDRYAAARRHRRVRRSEERLLRGHGPTRPADDEIAANVAGEFSGSDATSP